MRRFALAALVALAGCQVDIRLDVQVGSGPPPCAWTLNHSGVEECHVAGPLPDPPGSFMAVDTTSHLVL
jgi:hypothetical protein